ncbi:DNA gyrase subunit A [hydrothermal vent metagenome]|uniref:DNA topoisomerase (ATP-hydrolyzing) n=1 Tax=hydrothermal vent metagenome TaxID=652676 RepID=A0A3B1BMI5_9ZZZZ
MSDSEHNTVPVSIEDEMKSSFLEYAMSVIVSRALPDVRDGLKPVHRRILHAMNGMGNVYNKAYKKSARTVGEVIAKYHPHGDTAVYDAMVRMAQSFSLRYPLVDGQGNFGSVDGDSPAAMRYTEARLSMLSNELLSDLEKETVDFIPNYDESETEPVVLPSKIPNLLANGSGGIAVGMATNIPPHNLGEVIDAIVKIIDDPDISIEELMEVIPGPDFPTAGEIHGVSGIRSAYHTGRGLVVMRARAEIEMMEKGDRERIVIKEIPYQVNKSRLVEKMAELVRDKKIVGISDIRDESDRDGMRVVVELKKDAMGQVVLNQLYKHTQMQDTFGVILISLVNGQPKQLNLKEMLSYFVDHRREIITRRTLFELKKAKAREHLLEGYSLALDHINEVIELIRKAASPDDAKTKLVKKYEFSVIQAKAILELRLQRLTAMERGKILDELKEIKKSIQGLEFIRDHEEEKLKIIKSESLEIKAKFADERRTVITPVETEVVLEDLIAEEDMVVTISTVGYIKRNPLAMYRAQRRGGKGVKGMKMREEDIAQKLFVASTHDNLLFFTTKGRVFRKKVYEAPLVSRTGRGKAVVNLIQLKPDEKVATIFPVSNFDEGRYLITATRKGYVKKTRLEAFSRIHSGGIIAVDLEDDDDVMAVEVSDGNKRVFFSTKRGMAISFHESDLRPMGRVARGVRGIRLAKGDSIAGMAVIANDGSEKRTIFTIKGDGFGKRTEAQRYPLQKRGGMGVVDIKCDKETDSVVTVKKVKENDDLMVITREGQVIRIESSDVPVIGRNTKGVRVINLSEGDSVVSVAQLEDQAGAGSESVD